VSAIGGLNEITNQLATELVVPARANDDRTCDICTNVTLDEFELCDSCLLAEQKLSYVCRRVIPICWYSKPSAMRDRLTGYKSDDEPDERSGKELACIFSRFFVEHETRLRTEVGHWDLITVVPSTTRNPPHPLEKALDACAYWDLPLDSCLARGPGELGYRKYSDAGFTSTTDIAGKRVLMLEDVFTTGSRSLSAASAIHQAGAEAAAIVVGARRINPDYEGIPGQKELWTEQSLKSYDFAQWHW